MSKAPKLVGPGDFLTAGVRLHFVRGVLHLCELGPRAMTEFLEDLARQHDLVPDMLARFETYRRLSPAQVRAAGGYRFPHGMCAVPRDVGR
jgi:hypothetical protein